MSACIFCDIVAGTGEASIVATTDRAIAFMDLFPIGEGHTLVIPLAHATYLDELDPEDGAEMFRVGQRVAAALRERGLADGVNLFLADGEVAGQEVFHSHLHVLPRRPNDAMRLHVDYPPFPSREELDSVASGLRQQLG